ncbi:hypothetical protein [Spiroplasma endosymbiont of Nebria brevicollis]|uniref:hypothetical protein n=1 Tax=Spiroplasma endosymbiont of Nebria brevicollis TaxID=3066284 RepID=UPI00313C271A
MQTKKELILDEINTVTIIQQASQLGVSHPEAMNPLTMKVKANKLKEAINNLNNTEEIINIFIYSQNKEVGDEIDKLIWQKELLNELRIKTGVDLTKKDLEQFKISLSEIDDDHVVLNLEYKQEDGKVENLVTDKIKCKTNSQLLVNLFVGYYSMRYLKILKIGKSNIDEEIQNQLDKIKELKKELLSLIAKEDKEIKKQDSEKQETLEIFENNKQEKLNILLKKIEFVNNIQRINYFQKRLLAENKDFLIKADSFAKIHDLKLSFQNVENYLEQIIKTSPNNSGKIQASVNKIIDKLFSENFSELVEKYTNYLYQNL